MIPILPSEMIDQIIYHIRGDKDTLRACSLVCRTWVATSQSYIFHYVGIKNKQRAEAFNKLLDTSPHIAKYVKDVTMSDRASFWTPFLESTFPTLAPKLPLFTNVTILGLRYFKVSSAALLSLTSENFASIRTLWVLFCTFDNFQGLMALIAGYPRLENLSLQHASIDSDSGAVESTSINTAFPSSLRSIEFVGPGLRRLVQTMRAPQGVIYGVQSLRVAPETQEDIYGISELLSILGPSLQHLIIGMSRNKFSSGVQDGLVSISQSTSLRTLCFTYIRISAASPEWILFNQSSCEWVANTLSHVRSPNMTTIQITFSISYGDSGALGHFDLSRIDTILQRGVFEKLRRVDVMPCASIHEIERYTSDIRARMPGLNKRGLLRIS